MNYTLNQKLVHFIGGEKEGYAVVVALRNGEGYLISEDYKDDIDLLEFIEDNDPEVVLFGSVDYEGEFITEHNLDYYDKWDDDTDWTVLVTEETYHKRKTISDSIIEILKENNLDINNMIVKNGSVYSGYDECASYIQETYAWCSSSMSC